MLKPGGARFLVSRLSLVLGFVMAIGEVEATQARDNLASAPVTIPPAMPQPDYLQPAVDPVFMTQFVRVTEPGREKKAGVYCDKIYCTHRYSSAQAWNADQSLLIITNGCVGLCFLDGQTFEPLFVRRNPSACEWHPRDAALMICLHANNIATWAPKANEVKLIWQSEEYNAFEFGPFKGNPSDDGNRLAVRARNKDGELVAFAYDIAEKKKFPDIKLADLSGENNSVSISPSGRYIMFMQNAVDGVEQSYVYSVDGTLVQHWTEHHRPGHGDMTIDADGSDVYVGVSKSDPDKFHIIKRRLKDGKVTDLLPYGDGNHVSTRNINRPGWAIVSYSGHFFETDQNEDWAPFYQEVVAVRIDGSGEVRRIGHTRNADHDYWSETHASISPDGTQIIWSSNWGRAGGPVSDFVSRISWPEGDSKLPSRLGKNDQPETSNVEHSNVN